MNHRLVVAAAFLIAMAGQSTRAHGHPATVPGGPPPRLAAVRVSVPPVLDGRLQDAAWTLTPGTSQFTQQAPYAGAPPSERTTMRILYDDEALYIGFDCDQARTPIVPRLTRRDEDSESDWVWVYIDSRRDARTAYFLAVNVKGVLADGIMHDGAATTFEWDENWEARAATRPGGWSAEIRIPLRVLRFTQGLPVQDWGLWATRFLAARQETDGWPHITRDIGAPIPFFGRLDDLRNLAAGGIIEARPFVLGQARHRTADESLVNKGFDAGASAGLDLKLHLTQSLTLDAAVNPDFAQVEADQLILNLNNYEIQFPEKRPLFLEGADLFATPLGIFYSRRIGASPTTPTLNPDRVGPGARLVDVPAAPTIYGALKLVGRFGDAWTVGVLSALAARSAYDVQSYDATQTPTGPSVRHTVEPLTAFNVLRVRRELGQRSQIGAIATATTRLEPTAGARECPTGDNVGSGVRCFRDATVGGVDAVWRSPAAEYVAAGQLVGSAISDGRPEVQPDGTVIGSGDRGLGGWLRLAKEGGRNVVADVAYTGIGRRLTYNDLGFMPRQNLHEGKLGFELRSLTPHGRTLERHLRLDLSARRDLRGLDLGTLVGLAYFLRTKGFWFFRVGADFAPARFDDREIRDGSALEQARYLAGKLEVSTDPLALLSGGLKGELRFLDGGGTRLEAEAPLILRPLPQFSIELTPRLTTSSGEQRLARHADLNLNPSVLDPQYVFGSQLARGVGATLRASYTFTPRLSLQTFAQLFLAAVHFTDFRQAPRTVGSRIRQRDLAPLAAAPPTDADFEEAALNVNVVLRWEYRLGSTLFVVYSRSQVPSVALGSEEAALRLSSIGVGPAVDTVLVKLSFWWAS